MDAVTTILPDLRCNNACRFCEVAHAGVERVLSDEHVVTAIGRAQAGDVTEIVLTGGEVTLHDALVPWVRRAAAGGKQRVVVRTNGRMLAYKRLAAQLVDSGVSRVEVALHGPRAEIHDWHTRTEESFVQAVRGIRNLTRLGCTVTVNTVMTRTNYRHLSDFVPLLVKTSVTSWVLHELRARGAAIANHAKLSAPWAMISPHLRRAATKARRHGIPIEVVRTMSEAQSAL